MRLERIRTVDHAGHRQTVDIAVEVEGEWYVSGYEVDRSGSRVERWHVIDRAAIVDSRPLIVDRHYGQLRLAARRPQIVQQSRPEKT